jgi:transcription initiation factor IIF auxiliary subunit
VKIDGKEMTFAEIAALPKEKKDAILNNRAIMKPSKREAFDEFELQLANQTEKKIDTNIQAANQRIEEKR